MTFWIFENHGDSYRECTVIWFVMEIAVLLGCAMQGKAFQSLFNHNWRSHIWICSHKCTQNACPKTQIEYSLCSKTAMTTSSFLWKHKRWSNKGNSFISSVPLFVFSPPQAFFHSCFFHCSSFLFHFICLLPSLTVLSSLFLHWPSHALQFSLSA